MENLEREENGLGFLPEYQTKWKLRIVLCLSAGRSLALAREIWIEKMDEHQMGDSWERREKLDYVTVGYAGTLLYWVGEKGSMKTFGEVNS